jgi:hypothetical protein
MKWWQTSLVLIGMMGGSPAMADGPAWPNFPIVMWQDQTPARAAGLSLLGITGGRVFGNREGLSAEDVARKVAPMQAAGWRFYVENIATDLYAAYHRYQPDHPVTWAFDQLHTLVARNPRDPALFRREPSLSDAAALDVIRARMTRHVALFSPYRPLFYSLGDETGIADLAAAWDFDFGDASLAAMRVWLQGRYGTVAALNAQWGTQFSGWDAVVPMTTSAAIAGPVDNVSAWGDFKEWMDEAFARAVRAGTDAVHAADPSALAAIEGAQIPGWGGYDYSRLAHAVDVMEIYDFGNNVEIARDMNPALIRLSTMGVGDPGAAAALWRHVLLGSRGLVVWDEAGALVDESGAPSAAGLAAGVQFTELRDGLAAQIAASQPAFDNATILYSPASFRMSWLLDRKADNADWMARDAETEGKDSPLRAAMRTASSWFTHRGVPSRWVSEASVEAGGLGSSGILVLPHVVALSDAAVTAIRRFAEAGGVVLADIEPGQYDAHGRIRAALPLRGVVQMGLPDAGLLAKAGIAPLAKMSHPNGGSVDDVDMRSFRDGGVTLIGLQREAAGVEEVTLNLTAPGQVYDLRRHVDLGWHDRMTVKVSLSEPVILAVSPAKLPSLVVHGPATAQAGDEITISIGQDGPSPAKVHILRVEVLDPSQRVVSGYSGTLSLTEATSWRFRLATGDATGQWGVRVFDRLGDAVATWDIVVAGCAALACTTSAN